MIPKEFYQFGSFRLEPTERRIWKDQEVINLPPKEFDLLLALVEAGGGLCTGEQLYQKVWGDTTVEPQNVQVHISNVRSALGDSKGGPYKYIANVRGASGGYRLIPKVTHHQAVGPKGLRSLTFIGLGIAALIVGGAALLWRSTRPPNVSVERRLFALALQYERQGDDEEALRALDKSIALNPQFSEASLEAAYICHELEQDDRAAQYLAGAKAAKQGEALQMKVRALGFELDGDEDQALEEYQILSDRFPRDIEGQYHLADLALDMGRLEDAGQALQKCIDAEPNNPYCNMDLMVLKLLRNDFDGVLARYRELRAEGVHYPWFHVVTGVALLGKNDLTGATGEFDALEASQTKLHGKVHFRTGKEWIAEVQLYTGKAQSAVEQMKTALETADSPEERASSLLYIAKVESLFGNDNSAKSAAIESIHISNSPLTYISAAAVLAAIGDKTTMDRILSGRLPGGQEIGDVGPTNLDFMKGALALKQGNSTEAIRELTSSHELDNTDLYTIFLLGQAHERAGQWDRGSELFKQIIDAKGAVLWNEPSSLWALADYELANCYAGLGETEKAKSTYSEFLSLWSDADPETTQVHAARQALARLDRSHPD